MPKRTVLEMTQDILSSMDSDEINSITDTPESLQVATIIKTSYYDLIAGMDLPERFDLFQLDPSGDPLYPVTMTRPILVDKLLWIKYNKQVDGDTESLFQPVIYKTPEDFIEYVQGFGQTQDDDDLVSYSYDDFTLYCLNNLAPTYWTSFNDGTVVFDSYDAEVDGTLQSSKTLCYGKLDNEFLLEDDFIPAIDSDMFTTLYNEAKAMCFAELKQAVHSRAEAKVRQGWIRSQTSKDALPSRHPYVNTLPNYGRRPVR